MSNGAKLERRRTAAGPPRGLRLTGATRRAPMHSDLKVSAAAVDDKSCQDNEKYNCSGDRPPVIFAAPWVGPPTIVARAISAFKVLVYHIMRRMRIRLPTCLSRS